MSPDQKNSLNKFFILRVAAYIINKIAAIVLMCIVTEAMIKLWIFLISSLFDLFIIGELNVKPMTASAKLEVKK